METSRKPGRPRDPELESRRRAEILAVAGTVFAEDGFAAADMQVIADRIGIGKGTIYRYFPTKEALFLATVQNGLTELSTEMDAILAETEADPLDQLRRAIHGYLSFFYRRPEMAELFIQERAAFKHHHRPLYFQVKDEDKRCQHEALFDRLLAAKQIRPMPAERFFSVIGDLLYGTILTNLLTARPSEPTGQTQAILDVIFHGILSDESRRTR